MDAGPEDEATVYLVDDDPAARESVAALVRAHGLRAELFASAEEFLASAPRQPGCVVTDLRMQGMSGLDLLDELARRGSPMPVIVVSGFGDVPSAVRAMQGGAATFLQKPCSEQTLWPSIEQALERDRRRRAERRQREEARRRLATLSSSERDVLDLVLAGKANKEVAAALDIGLRTVELRRAEIKRRTGADSVPELVRLVILAQPGEGDPPPGPPR
jgi:FixJ family two-component response regulator